MISEDIPESGRISDIPLFWGFKFTKETKSDTSDISVFFEVYGELSEVACEEASVGIEKYQNIPASMFRRSIHREAESAIAGEREERE